LKDFFSVASDKMTSGLHTLKIGLSLEKRFAFPEPNPKSSACSQKGLQIASEDPSTCKKGSAEADNTAPYAPPLNLFVGVSFEGSGQPKNRFFFQILRFIRIPPSVGADKRSPVMSSIVFEDIWPENQICKS
jgi:hypothetical protein